MNAAPAPFVSVIVPVYDRADALRCCLEPLGRQRWPVDRYEVIVVDNGAPDDLAAVVAEVPMARLARESRPGSYAARNRGVSLARGEVFAFIDADCIPDEDWIEQGVAALDAAPDAGYAAGRVDMFAHDPARPTAAELYDLTVLRFRQDRNVTERSFGATANLFVRRAEFERVGPFDQALKSGGDLEWGVRATALGYPGVYADRARVRHPARRSLAETLKRAARHAGGTWQLGAPRDSRARRVLDLLRSLTPAVHFYVRILTGGDPPAWRDRVKVVWVALLVKYAGAWERIRLGSGGEPNRG